MASILSNQTNYTQIQNALYLSNLAERDIKRCLRQVGQLSPVELNQNLQELQKRISEIVSIFGNSPIDEDTKETLQCLKQDLSCLETRIAIVARQNAFHVPALIPPKIPSPGIFTPGRQIGTDKIIQLPDSAEPLIIFCPLRGHRSEFGIYEREGKLVVLEENRSERGKYVISQMSVASALLKASGQGNNYFSLCNFAQVLSHNDFAPILHQYLAFIFAANVCGHPAIFEFSDEAFSAIIEAASKVPEFDPLKIIDPISGHNLFMYAANRGYINSIEKLVELFPETFKSIGQDVIRELLLHTPHSYFCEGFLANEFERIGGKLDTFHRLMLQIPHGFQSDLASFRSKIAKLPSSQQHVIYEIAFNQNNPDFHEAPEHPVPADQYSVNLMWINKNKMPADQEFLIGSNAEELHQRFIMPVSKWAKTNPRSPLNIWIDGALASQKAIETARQALQKALADTHHAKINFRDVRSMDVVRSNPRAFNEDIPVYFRVDLLRAVAADHTLRTKETRYFVYGDLDMEPLTSDELFDKQTVGLLDEYGFVMAKGGHLGFENGFQILSGEHLQFMDSHRKVIVDLSIDMAQEYPKAIREQQIYDTYPAMITHYWDAIGRYGKLVWEEEYDNGIKREIQTTGLKRFRFDKFKHRAHGVLPLGTNKISLKSHGIVPSKPVRLPPSHFK